MPKIVVFFFFFCFLTEQNFLQRYATQRYILSERYITTQNYKLQLQYCYFYLCSRGSPWNMYMILARVLWNKSVKKLVVGATLFPPQNMDRS